MRRATRNARRRDAVAVTIAWTKLIAAVEEASATLLRTAFSRVVTESYDYSCAVMDAEGALLVQPQFGLPGFVGALSTGVKKVLDAVPPRTLRPGDVLLTNDPYIGTSQLNDFMVITPVFRRGRIVAYAANISHSPDVGGRLLSAEGRELYEEGLRLPIVHLFRRGRRDEGLIRILRTNVRVPDIVEGDLMAQVAANTVVSRELLRRLEAGGAPDLADLSREILGRSERLVRERIRGIPDGTYVGAVTLDGLDEPLTIRATVTVRGGTIAVDYAGTSPQTMVGLNCAFNYAYAETAFAVLCVARPLAPINAGSLRPIRVSAPAGCLLNAQPPAALGARTLVVQFIEAAIFQALAQAAPERVMGEAAAPVWVPMLSGVDQYGRRFVELLFLNGGFGGRPGEDGTVVGFPSSVTSTTVELLENEKPFVVEAKEWIPDSAGAGRFRGGPGMRFVLRSESPEPVRVALRVERLAHAPRGVAGGLPGRAGRIGWDGEGPLPPKGSVLLRRGQRITFETPGGGGFGDPTAREPARVAEDVANGLVGAQAARAVYGARPS